MNSPDLTALAHSQMPFSDMLDVAIVSGSAERVEATGVWKPEHCTAGGMIHGGYLMAVADSVGALCVFLNLPQGAATSTIESKTNFFRPVTSGMIEFTATPVHAGRTIIVTQTDASDGDGKLVSRTTQSQAVIAPRE